ncbi:MAG: hypothetical protein NTZ05_01125, partial [Chloroflexi bacterium]|nr:hypothetical protein [Chloroflexota bacterium]
MTWEGMADQEAILSDERTFLEQLITSTPWISQNGAGSLQSWEIAAYLRDNILNEKPHARILVDDQQATDIVVLFGKQAGAFVVPNVMAFADILLSPAGKIDYLLIPNDHAGGRDLVRAAYPHLYDEGATFADLVHEFDGELGWRLYRI